MYVFSINFGHAYNFDTWVRVHDIGVPLQVLLTHYQTTNFSIHEVSTPSLAQVMFFPRLDLSYLTYHHSLVWGDSVTR